MCTSTTFIKVPINGNSCHKEILINVNQIKDIHYDGSSSSMISMSRYDSYLVPIPPEKLIKKISEQTNNQIKLIDLTA